MQPLVATSRRFASPAIDWWQDRVIGPNGHLSSDMKVYAAARLVSPSFAATHSLEEIRQCVRVLPTATNEEPRPRFRPLFTADQVAAINTELDSDKAAAEERKLVVVGDQPLSTVEWWRERKQEGRFPALIMALRKVAALLQTSASCERVFSQLDQVISQQQENNMLVDNMECFLWARYNRRGRTRGHQHG